MSFDMVQVFYPADEPGRINEGLWKGQLLWSITLASKADNWQQATMMTTGYLWSFFFLSPLEVITIRLIHTCTYLCIFSSLVITISLMVQLHVFLYKTPKEALYIY